METQSENTSSSKRHDAIQTLFSVNSKNQLELISIADNKANMIAAICTAINFVIIALFCLDLSILDGKLSNSLEFVLPMGILVAFCSVSVVCAIFALKPKIIRSSKDTRSALFFHNNYRLTMEEYKAEMYKVMDSPDHIYDHMLRTMYFNTLVLERKYALLGFAYQIFLLAIFCSGLAYAVTIIT